MATILDDPSVIHAPLDRLRKTFKTDKTKSIAFRKQQLKNLLRGMDELMPMIQDGLVQDLARIPFLNDFFEINTVKDDINHALANIDAWAKPTVVDTPLLLGPARSYVVNEPFGVALVIGPWNYPITTTLGPLVGAIAAGNCVLVKPSELSSNTSRAIKSLMDKYLDPDCYHCVEGGIEVAKALLLERYDLIIFTGSTDKGKLIAKAAAEYMTPTILELGGKSPTIIDAGANLNNAALRICQGRFSNAGQTCIAADYLLVNESIAEQFIPLLKDTVIQFFGTEPKKSADLGRMITEGHTQRASSLLKDCGGQVILGGDFDVSQKYISPTLILNPDPNSELAKQEIFAPILPIFIIKDLQQAIDFIKAREKPLALYYFGNNSAAKERILSSTSSGAVLFNECLVHFANQNLPFGGIGHSGLSQYHGKWGFDSMTHPKAVLDKGAINMWPFSLRYPPFTPGNQKLFLTMYKWMNFTQYSAWRWTRNVVFAILVAIGARKGFFNWFWPFIDSVWQNVRNNSPRL